jgi:hydrogenase maturation factor
VFGNSRQDPAGFALNKMSESEARETLDALRELDELGNAGL